MTQQRWERSWNVFQTFVVLVVVGAGLVPFPRCGVVVRALAVAVELRAVALSLAWFFFCRSAAARGNSRDHTALAYEPVHIATPFPGSVVVAGLCTKRHPYVLLPPTAAAYTSFLSAR